MLNPILNAPSCTVIGSTDPERLVAFLSVFGGQPRRVPSLPAATARALYGVEQPLRQFIIDEPGFGSAIRIVETPHPAPQFAPLQAGPYGIDYYTRDIELSTGMLKSIGAQHFSPLVGYTGTPSPEGPQITGHVTHELLLIGPDELAIFLTDVNSTSRPWPTALNDAPRRTHSELLQACWVVTDMELDKAFWVEEAGLHCVLDEIPEVDEMQRLMFTPGNSPLRCVHVTEGIGGHKIEMMSYPEESVGRRPDWPLRGGLHASAFRVGDLDAACEKLPSAQFGPVARADLGSGMQRAVSATSPGSGVRFELWEAPERIEPTATHERGASS
ncbi:MULTISPECIES: VOC family protein [unclassified Mycolicibacterium]|uniref:VOC family protein n=1 Tax=unclassified Mycolicibacterium TaxID=2636767 RepID=UPI002ED83A12